MNFKKDFKLFCASLGSAVIAVKLGIIGTEIVLSGAKIAIAGASSIISEACKALSGDGKAIATLPLTALLMGAPGTGGALIAINGASVVLEGAKSWWNYVSANIAEIRADIRGEAVPETSDSEDDDAAPARPHA